MREIQPFTVWSLAASYLDLPQTPDIPENLSPEIRSEIEHLVQIWAERLVQSTARRIRSYIEGQTISRWQLVSAFAIWRSSMGQFLMGKSSAIENASTNRVHSVVLASEVLSFSPSEAAFPDSIDYCVSQDELLYCYAVCNYPKDLFHSFLMSLSQVSEINETSMTLEPTIRKKIIDSFFDALDQRVVYRINSIASEKRRALINLGPRDWQWNSAKRPIDLTVKRGASILNMQAESVILYSLLYGINLDSLLCMCPALYHSGKLYFYHAADHCYRQLPNQFREYLLDYQSLSPASQQVLLRSILSSGIEIDFDAFARADILE